jgi:DNA mismatch repair protein MLH1
MFSIIINRGRLIAMPDVLPGYVPLFTALPLFLVRLATDVDWDRLMNYIPAVMTERALLYAILPEDAKSPDQKERLKVEVEKIILPTMKTDPFQPTVRSSTDRSVIRTMSVADLYPIFERTGVTVFISRSVKHPGIPAGTVF